jgi:hypothetical protein
MTMWNHDTPVWEPITLSDTTAQNYNGVLCLTAGTFIFRSEATGSDMSVAMTAGMTLPGKIVLAKSTGASGSYAGGRPY